MSKFVKVLIAGALLMLFAGAPARGDGIFNLTGVITDVGPVPGSPTQTIVVNFDFTIAPYAFWEKPYVLPGGTFSEYGALGSTSGTISDFILEGYNFSPLPFGINGGELDLTASPYDTDPYHAIGAELYSCYSQQCRADFPDQFRSPVTSFVYTVTPVAEPSIALLLVAGLACLSWITKTLCS